MQDAGFKPLYLSYACKDLLKSCYTKSDIKKIDEYAASFPTHEAVDAARTRLKPQIDTVFNQWKQCVNEHQMRKILKSQPIDVKFFIFERFAVIIAFLDHNNVKALKVESIKPVGLAFAEAIESIWQRAADSMKKHGTSLSEFSLRTIETYG